MIKAIVFDLDGTLWHTGESYIYAYHKLCDLYGVTERLSDSVIEDCLGVKIDQVLLKLFPHVEDRELLTYRALTFAAEYLLMHPDDSCFENVSLLLCKLAETYKVYIVSNCLRGYADTFVRISATAQYISGIYTIEDGEKTEHLRKIAAAVDGKLLLVGDSNDDLEALTDPYNQYFCYARYGYKPCDQYDYAISAPMELLDVLEKIRIKERQIGNQPYRMFSRGDNQITLIRKDERTSYFGYVNYADEDFDQVVKQLKENSSGRLIGPINANTYYPYRFAADNYDWQLYPDCYGKEALVVFTDNGFRVHKEYYSTLAQVNQTFRKTVARTTLSDEYKTVILSGQEVYRHLDDIYTVAVEAFSDAYLYEPIRREDFIEIYIMALKNIAPDLVMIYRQEQPVAFCFCYEDPQKRFYVCKTIAVKKSERRKNIISKLVDCAYTMMEQRGHNTVLHHYMNLSTKRKIPLFMKNHIRQKKYVLLEFEHDK